MLGSSFRVVLVIQFVSYFPIDNVFKIFKGAYVSLILVLAKKRKSWHFEIINQNIRSFEFCRDKLNKILCRSEHALFLNHTIADIAA